MDWQSRMQTNSKKFYYGLVRYDILRRAIISQPVSKSEIPRSAPEYGARHIPAVSGLYNVYWSNNDGRACLQRHLEHDGYHATPPSAPKLIEIQLISNGIHGSAELMNAVKFSSAFSVIRIPRINANGTTPQNSKSHATVTSTGFVSQTYLLQTPTIESSSLNAYVFDRELIFAKFSWNKQSGLPLNVGLRTNMFDTQLPSENDGFGRNNRIHTAHMSPGQASLFWALLSLENRPYEARVEDPTHGHIINGLAANRYVTRTRVTICDGLVLDHRLDNSAWMDKMLFDPTRVADKTRDYIIRHYHESEGSRQIVMLIANILKSIAFNPSLDPDYSCKALALERLIRRSLAQVANRPLNPSREVDAREARKGLYHTIEFFAASRFAPVQMSLNVLREAAPVFRRALSGPLNEYVHLPTALLHPEPNIRNYPLMDIVYSMVTGLPTNVKYNTVWYPGATDYALLVDDQGHLGMSWLNGLPNQLIVVLARINALSEDDGTDSDIEMVYEIEESLRTLYKEIGDHSRLLHPTNKLRVAVPRAWCQAGVVTSNPDERSTILTRLFNLPENTLFDSGVRAGIQSLQDVWARADVESRPAEWIDYRLAAVRVAVNDCIPTTVRYPRDLKWGVLGIGFWELQPTTTPETEEDLTTDTYSLALEPPDWTRCYGGKMPITMLLSPAHPRELTRALRLLLTTNDIDSCRSWATTFIGMEPAGSSLAVSRTNANPLSPSCELDYTEPALRCFSGSDLPNDSGVLGFLGNFNSIADFSSNSSSPQTNHDGNGVVQLSPTADYSCAIPNIQQTGFEVQPDSYSVNDSSSLITLSQGYNQAPLGLSSSRMTSAQASLFHALMSLEGPPSHNDSPILTSTCQPFSSPARSYSSPMQSAADMDLIDEDADSDPEHIEAVICANQPSTFGLQLIVTRVDAIWMRRTVFDPSRAASKTKDYVVRHFAESEQSRCRTILIANIFRSIGTNPAFDSSYLPKLSMLRTAVQRNLIDAAKRKTNPSREVQSRESIRLIAASRYDAFHACLGLMREAAMVFRRACPEPMDQRVHLPSVLMHPNANMRHFPVMDVYFSMITGLPTILKYDTSLRTPVDASVLYIDNHLGLSWLYGQPDQITLILARINSLYQDYGSSVDPGVVREIERGVEDFKVNSGSSPDPSLLVMRLVVQECWRQVTLCSADALDSRVRAAQRKIMKLATDAKPSATLDMHLATCIAVAGVATFRPAERKVILARLRGLPECSIPESGFSTCVRVLGEVWSRTDRENRAARWSDLGLANSRILGI
ncbi:hypothetical protein AG1IA_09383 [Rhizoctonia solani AG-1 IA]|uniref:Uncharacterized protein n=1 Tax=Thanatephorus cucumeris (strain AG1-IA) TaxID=983506 RepID=L8WF33_THACA|nr:hypothetical protein AG1IA_09383 [Rhizoctonia solani AG-1 IA]